MKKHVLFAVLLILTINTAVFAQNKNQNQMRTVASVDLKRYSGKWFEIARYPNKFQKKCVGNTTATYNLKSNSEFEVLNRCVTKNGTFSDAVGKGRVADEASSAKLEVRFAPGYLSFIPATWGDYWIIDLDANYQYAAVGDPKREYFWILSRKAEMDDATYQNILRRAEAKGFNPGKVVKTPQNIEVIKGAVIEKQ
ncbi:MAG: Lipocalin family protein [Acidobacteria bacterium]|jgi:apolipoprotein D and lipocalin family protein|nr:Lipocalin family protein [Acidobacteriota bacterium]